MGAKPRRATAKTRLKQETPQQQVERIRLGKGDGKTRAKEERNEFKGDKENKEGDGTEKKKGGRENRIEYIELGHRTGSNKYKTTSS